jgi:aspartyl protease family protein
MLSHLGLHLLSIYQLILLGECMGMEDRDYFLSKVNQPGGTHKVGGNTPVYRHHSFAKRTDSSGRGKLWLLVFLVLVLFWVASDKLQRRAKSIQNQQPQVQELAEDEAQQEVDLIPGGLIIKADPTGHFRGQVLINDLQMPFMIDTGATQTVIPESLAVKAGLPVGRQVQTSTAGGQVANQLTRLSTLKLGNAELKNLQALISPHLDVVLIGMNTLKYFQMTQYKDTLTLIATHDVAQVETLEKDLPVQMPPPAFLADIPAEEASSAPAASEPKVSKSWKKTMVCDANQPCRPSYGYR